MKNLLILFALFVAGVNAEAQVTVENDPSVDYQKDLAPRTNFDGINFSMQGPLHFVVPDTGFFGFIHPGMGSSIAIAEIPYRSYTNVADEFANKDFSESNSKLISSEDIILDNGKKGHLFKVRFAIEDQLVERLVLIIGTDKKTYMVYANYPGIVAPMINPVLTASFKTCVFEE